VLAGSITLILRLSNQQQVARKYDVFGRWILSSKCYLAAFIAITGVLAGSITLILRLSNQQQVARTYCEISTWAVQRFRRFGLLQKRAYINIK
jgi:hypothetical protein